MALDAARELVAAGMPVFLAPACAPDCPIQGHGRSGWHIPRGWPTTPAGDTSAIEDWRPGDALAAVCGHTLDVIDVDPRNGGESTASALRAAGLIPHVYAAAATPSGGAHWFVAPLGCSKDNSGRLGQGVDYQGGAVDGSGRGFVFIAPTVRPSAVDGVPRPYVWLRRPNAEVIRAEVADDDTGAALADMLRRERPARAVGRASVTPARFATSARRFTAAEAEAYVWPRLTAFAEQGYDGQNYNARLNDLAVMLGHFVPHFLSRQAAEESLYDAAVACGCVSAPPGATYRPMGERGVRSTIRSGLDRGQAEPYQLDAPDGPGKGEAEPSGDAPDGRKVDLMPYLDGSYIVPEPAVGGELEGSRFLLYPGRWHTMIASTGAGKSWWALWHAVAEMRRGNVVTYAHFEEASPVITLERLRAVAPEMDNETICKLLVWLDCTRAWADGEFAAALPADTRLVVLDGINAAATAHRGDPNSPEGVAAYRARFVAPACAQGAAVLSLGHPPKGRDRQDERHGFGSTAWLDEVDGVGFRMRAAKAGPIRRGHDGAADIYCVKDRGGTVEARGQRDDGESREGWTYLGRFHVDSSPGRTNTVAWMTGPVLVTGGHTPRAGASDEAKVLAAIRELAERGQPATVRAVRGIAEIGHERADLAIERLKFDQTIIETCGERRARLFAIVPQTTVPQDQDD
jgi:hypothetical protein